MSNEFGFENLEVWKKVRQFKIDIVQFTKSLPASENYRLKDQILRSSRSINALITEGYGRFTYADQIHFCIQARGSLNEPINHLIDAFDEGYIDDAQVLPLKKTGKEIERLINGYISYLRKQKANS